MTVVVLARNEAANLRRCLESAAWCDELVVVDDHSTDETPRIAEALGARVVKRRFETFASQRNWALDAAGLKHRWVLMLDADEELTPEGRREIERELSSADGETAAFRMCRRTMFLGRWLRYSDGFPVWIMRLVDRDRARFVDQGHGEMPVPPVPGRMGTLHEPFVHHPFHRGLSHWLERHIGYAEREARMELARQAEASLGDLFGRDPTRRRRALRNLGRRLPGRPLLRFAYQYVWKRGFLEGRAGLAFSMLMAVYEAMIVVKRWELEWLRSLPPDETP